MTTLVRALRAIPFRMVEQGVADPRAETATSPIRPESGHAPREPDACVAACATMCGMAGDPQRFQKDETVFSVATGDSFTVSHTVNPGDTLVYVVPTVWTYT